MRWTRDDIEAYRQALRDLNRLRDAAGLPAARPPRLWSRAMFAALRGVESEVQLRLAGHSNGKPLKVPRLLKMRHGLRARLPLVPESGGRAKA